MEVPGHAFLLLFPYNLASHLSQVMHESRSTHKDLKHILTAIIALHSYPIFTLFACMVEEGYRLLKSDQALLVNLQQRVAFLVERDSLTYIVEIYGRFYNAFHKVGFFMKHVSCLFLPEVEKIVLEKFLVTHDGLRLIFQFA